MGAEHEEPDHLSPGTLAAYVDGALPVAERSLAESHLADCDTCRGDLVAASRLANALVPVRRWYLPAAVAAAAVLVLVMGRETAPTRSPEPLSREPVISATVAPVAIAPRGAAGRQTPLTWTSVPYADLYRVTVFDDAGNVAYESQARDTSVVIPASIVFQARTAYFWKVEAQTGWNRWIPSELTEFSIETKAP